MVGFGHERWPTVILQAQGGEVATESPPVKAKPKVETATAKEAKDGGVKRGWKRSEMAGFCWGATWL